MGRRGRGHEGEGAKGGRGRGHVGKARLGREGEGAKGGQGQWHVGNAMAHAKVIAGQEGDSNRALHHKMKAKGKAMMCRMKKARAEEEKT